MNKEEREMVCELLNWIAECGEATASTRPMMHKAANLFGLYELDKWVLRPDDSCSWHDPFYGAGTS
jgi:hypothetical protein